MSKHLIEHLIQEQTAAIAVLQRQITTHETIRLVLMDLHKHAIMEDQALALLQQEAEHLQDREQTEGLPTDYRRTPLMTLHV